MSFGQDDSEWRDWMLGEAESREIIERAIDLGITFFDTAHRYAMGDSERMLGEVLSEYDRNQSVVATKVHPKGSPEGYPRTDARGLSRKAIDHAVEGSLDRLGMDVIDLYQIHRWDPETPIEETLRVLDDVVDRGQARYLGASSMWTHQFADALHTSDVLGLERFVSMQNHYNLAYREEEREMLPLCQNEGIGVMPWSPLARGYLSRPESEVTATERGKTEEKLYEQPYRDGGGIEVNEHVEQLAAEKGVSMAQIALAWLLHKDWVDTPIIGTTSVAHLEDAVEALDISLSSSEMEYLEAPYEPVPVSW
jgi:aryl-alcohol dehydrogenase-like predicted oxidoreductase